MADDAITLLERPISPQSDLERIYVDTIVRQGIFPAGRFSIALPRNWLAEPAGENAVPGPDNPVVMLVRFTPDAPDIYGAEIGAKVIVVAAFLPRVINGSDWLRTWLTAQGHDVHALEELPTAYGLMGEALTTDPATGRLHRMMTVKDGDLMYLIDGSVDHRGRPDWPHFQEIPLMALIRFQLLDPSDEPYAEPMADLEMTASEARASFSLPVSWLEVAPGDTIPDGDVRQMILPHGDAVAGTLVAMLGAKYDRAQDFEDNLTAKLTNQGMSFEAPQQILSATNAGTFMEAFFRRGTSQGTAVTLLCLRAVTASGPLSLCLLGPAAEADFEKWAVNRRVFEIAMETLSITPT